jgi:glycosyltransferase involved in cell wall biosynthesis
LVPNGCDLDMFTPVLRQTLTLPGVASGDFVAGFTGAHGMANGLEAVLDAAAELQRRGRRDIKFAFIGDGKRKEALIARARREQLDNCIFLAPVRKTELARITASLGCGLQVLANVPAFYYGTSPNKFFDYLSAGVPVVNNYPGWLADLIATHQCGVAVPPDDPGALANALCWLADHPAERKACGENARRLAEAEFARPKLAQRFVEIIEESGASAHIRDS